MAFNSNLNHTQRPVANIGDQQYNDIVNGNVSIDDLQAATLNGFYVVKGLPEIASNDNINGAAYVGINSSQKLQLNKANLWKTDLQPEKTYVLSFYTFGIKDSTQHLSVDSSMKIAGEDYTFDITPGKTNGWNRVSFKLMIPSTGIISDPIASIVPTTSSVKFYISNVQLEYGEEATDWAPSSGEIQSMIRQTRDEIILRIKNTGIDIENGKITLSADNTSINGNLAVGGTGSFTGDITATSFQTTPQTEDGLQLKLANDQFQFNVGNQTKAYFEYTTRDGITGLYLFVWDDAINDYKWINLSNEEMWHHETEIVGNLDTTEIKGMTSQLDNLSNINVNTTLFDQILYKCNNTGTYHTSQNVGDGSKYLANGYYIQNTTLGTLISNIVSISGNNTNSYSFTDGNCTVQIHLVYKFTNGIPEYIGMYFYVSRAKEGFGDPYGYDGPYIWYSQSKAEGEFELYPAPGGPNLLKTSGAWAGDVYYLSEMSSNNVLDQSKLNSSIKNVYVVGTEGTTGYKCLNKQLSILQ